MPTLTEKRDSRVGVSGNRYNDTSSKMEKIVIFVLCRGKLFCVLKFIECIRYVVKFLNFEIFYIFKIN
jgi:hypothetical protein